MAQNARNQDERVTAVTGESWLVHLNRTFDETSMGKTGRLGPPEPIRAQYTGVEARPTAESSPTVSLSGADMYRLNCRACHGELGLGAPPEINSVINPVRASSTAMILERMKNAGMEIGRAEASKLAEQSKAALLQRLHNGGQDMPAFPHLSEAEVKILIGYLKQLAEVPGAERERGMVRTSPLRVGEHIVKSTCHICHGATGENPTPPQLSDGAIPPLSTLSLRVNRAQFVQKVTKGAPIVMGTPALLCRGRMPVFYYLSEEEASDVYDYLLAYPPGATGNADPPATLLQASSAYRGDVPKVGSSSALEDPTALRRPNRNADSETILLPIAGLLFMTLVGGGVGLTIREMRKLTREGENHKLVVRAGGVNKTRVSTEKAHSELIA